MEKDQLLFNPRLLHSKLIKGISCWLIFAFVLTQCPVAKAAPEQTVAQESSPPSDSASSSSSEPESAPSSESNLEAQAVSATAFSAFSDSSAGGSSASLTPFQNSSYRTDLITGAASLSIPIVVPLGRKGLQPNLSLSYSSNSANGVCGVGWDLGLGSIQRNTKNGVPKYDGTDSFVANINGASIELVDIGDGEYRAKQEGAFLKFTFDGSAWQVKDKSGTTYAFGSGENSRQADANRIFKWCLDRITDLQENYLTISYLQDQGQIYPQQIQYTGKVGAELPTNTVEFIYEARNESFSDYRSNFEVQTTKRLSTIDIKANGQRAAKYVLTYAYSPDTGRSLLTALTQYGSDGTTALPPLTFEYQRAETAFSAAEDLSLNAKTPIFGDFNGDGLIDSGSYNKTDGSWSVSLANPAGGFSPLENWLPAFGPNNEWQYVNGDFNGDGKTDVAIFNQSNGQWEVGISDGARFNDQGVWATFSGVSTNSIPITGDFNGDGISDVGIYNKSNGDVNIALSNKSRFTSPNLDSYTKLLLHCNDTDGSTAFADSSFGHTVTAYGNAQVDTSQSKFGGASAYFDGNGDYLTIPDSDDWYFGTEDFTIDFWVYFNSLTGEQFFVDQKQGGSDTWYFKKEISNDLYFSCDGGGGDTFYFLRSWSPSTGVWYHLALVRSGYDMKMYVNGTQLGETYNVGNKSFGSFNAPLVIGNEEVGGAFAMDGYMDEIRISKGIARWTANFTPPTQESGGSTTWIDGLLHSSTAQAFTGDFNGDGLIDIGVFNDGSWSFAVSTGTGFISKSEWNVSFGASKTPVISDFNQDGLTDIGVFDKDSGRWQIYRCTGNGFVSGGDWLNNFGQGEYNTPYALDFNGDGLVDPTVLESNGLTWTRKLNQGKVPDLLQKFTNGLGGTTEITYKASIYYDNTGEDDQCDLPFSIQTVSAVKQDDGRGNFYQTSYAYANGLYAPQERETRGFDYVKVTDSEGNTSETWFKQDDIYKGLPYKTQISDSSGKLYLATSKTYAHTVPYPGATFAYLQEETTSLYDGQSIPKVTQTTYEYDHFGNPTKIKLLGEKDVAGDEKETNIEYVYNPDLWILGLPSYSYLKDAQGKITSQKWLYYDNNTANTAIPTQGNLTKEEVWLDTKSQRLSTTYSYDGYGNVLTSTDARGKTMTTAYEETYHTYPKTVTNTLGQSIQYTYEPKTGQVLTTTDPNGQTSRNEYDVFGRLSKVFGPNDDTTHPGTWYEYDLASRPVKITTHTRVEHNTNDSNKIFTSYAFYDGLGRLIQTKSQAEDSAKQIVGGIVTFNSRGLVKEKYLPYYLNANTPELQETYSTPDYSGPKVAFEYDPLGRVIKTTSLNESGQPVTSTVQYERWTKTETDANGHKTKYTTDAYGQLIKVEEFNGQEIYTTSYTYDTQGNLIKTIDNQNNVTTINYDSLGRKISMDDPDMGHWSYDYDANGNLTKQTDAKGQVIEFGYDALNRLTTKSLRASVASEAISIIYSYDATTKPNCIGRLSKVTDQSGSTEFFYDNLGREIKTIKSLRAAEGGEAISYTVQRTYDAQDRLTSLTYPNGKVANYTYNRQGAIETVSTPNGGITKIDYTASGQLKLIQYSNGTQTQYNYSSNTLRLHQLQTASSSATLQDLTYSFDNIGNVKTITDNSPSGTNTQSFQYDNLDRLVQATGESYATINYQYDSIGNMTGNGALQMNYGAGSAGPHAVTSTTGAQTLAMTYDQNGNMLTKAQAQYQYDAENRLISVTAPSLRGGEADEAISIDLTPGWNFISIPLELSDYSCAAVLSSIAGKYDQVTRYNSTTSKFESFINNPKFNQFNAFTFGEGYLIHVTSACTLTVTGQPANSPTRQLKAGWNLIASPTTEVEIPTQVALNNLVQGTDYSKVCEYNGSGYTDNPSTLKKGKAYYIYCLRDCTWQIPSSNKEITTFAYDGDGGRVKKTTSLRGSAATEAISTTYIGSLYEVDSNGTTRNHIFSGSNRICTIDTPTGQSANSQTYFYHQDHIGSSNVISDKTGTQAQLLEYTPYGLTKRVEGSYNINYRFTGKLFDNSSGLYYYGARYYDPELGRFTQADTIIQSPYDPQSLNRYSYCRNNPINYVDPSGHWSWKKFWHAAVGALVGVALTIVLGPAGLGMSLGMAGMIGGAAGGALTGGLEGGWKGAMIGAAIGGTLGGIGGWAAGLHSLAGNLILGGMMAGGVGYTAVTGNWESLAGGVAGAITGAAVGGGITSTYKQQFSNFRAGNGFVSNKTAAFNEFAQKMKSRYALNVDQRDKTVGAIYRPLGKNTLGDPGSTTGPRHGTILWDELPQGKWEMGPQNGIIQTTNTADNLSGWGTHITTEKSLALGGRYVESFNIQVNGAALQENIALYESTFAGKFPYGAFNHNSNFAVNSVIYGAGGDVPEGVFAPGLPNRP